ncbi:RagB/SusD family nutrient uptake outer membrane protein [Flavobacterium sp. TAB 87]|uniref:RagB/SusD family nutrient uptake outer membrane protein n=1 Tax=Flavobacterium sp. TAB 87 TaxID=1729581 RepID=UPI00076CBE24|nr:RagB/SusD family nutrient uptake outer membrane protein [Flavobacterium sp. TAB 87]KVV13699.1 SusD family protein [Flavobacterium sp. TAB 87]
MKLKYKNIPVLLSMMCLGLTSCSDSFLDIKPEQNVAAEDAVIDLVTLQTAINGMYSKLQDSDYYGRTMYVIPELMADNLYLSSRNTGRYLEFENFVVSDRNTYAEGTWNQIYEVVVNATRAIEGGKLIEVTTAEQQKKIDQLVGEAYTVRALAHFDLVRLYAQPYNFTANATHAGVPVVTAINTNQVSPSRNNVSEVYTQINSDLAQALLLMTNQKASGYFSVSGAKALAARVALYQENNLEAIKQSTEVINTSAYSLMTNANYLKVWNTAFNSESIFEIVNTIADSEGTNSLGHFFSVAGYADALVTTELLGLYDSNDIRKSVIVQGAKPGAEKNALFVGKFPNGTKSDDNIRLFRLAEQYLIRAEAYAKEGNDILAQQDLNLIVKRAQPNATTITDTGANLLDRILLERRKELAFEGHRLFDLNRNKKNVNIIQSENAVLVNYPNDKFILPIPLSEINANPNIKPQNNGY